MLLIRMQVHFFFYKKKLTKKRRRWAINKNRLSIYGHKIGLFHQFFKYFLTGVFGSKYCIPF